MNFKDSLKQHDFVITSQVNLVQTPDAESLIRQAKILRPAVDAVQLTDNSSTQLQMSGLAAAARRLRDNGDGAHVPESIVERLERASDPEREGVEICAELLRELASIPGVSGANLMTLGRLETIPAAIEASGVRSR